MESINIIPLLPGDMIISLQEISAETDGEIVTLMSVNIVACSKPLIEDYHFCCCANP